jgi:hypothetical protein
MALRRAGQLIGRQWPALAAARGQGEHRASHAAGRWGIPRAQALYGTAAPAYETVEVSLREGYAVLTLNRPKALNALSTQVPRVGASQASCCRRSSSRAVPL